MSKWYMLNTILQGNPSEAERHFDVLDPGEMSLDDVGFPQVCHRNWSHAAPLKIIGDMNTDTS